MSVYLNNMLVNAYKHYRASLNGVPQVGSLSLSVLLGQRLPAGWTQPRTTPVVRDTAQAVEESEVLPTI